MTLNPEHVTTARQAEFAVFVHIANVTNTPNDLSQKEDA